MRKAKVWMSLVLTMVLMGIAGCGGAPKTATPGGDSKTPAQSTQTPAAPEPKTLTARIAPGPWGGVLWLSEMVAEGTGAFKEQGVDLSVLKTPGGNDASKALMAGEADFALLAYDHVLKNRAQGADLVVVSFLNQNPGLIMIVQNDLKGKVTSIKDLKGMKIGVSSLGGGTHSAVLSLMKQAGMNPNDVEFVAAKDKLADMWDKKQISAAMHVDPQITELTGSNKAWTLYDFRKTKDTVNLYGTGYPLGTLVTRQEILEKNPELVKRVVQAIQKGSDFIKGHSPAEIANTLPAEYKAGFDPKLYELMVTENIEALSLTGTVPQASMETVLRELIEKQVIPADAKVDIPTSINLQFLAGAR